MADDDSDDTVSEVYEAFVPFDKIQDDICAWEGFLYEDMRVLIKLSPGSHQAFQKASN